MIGGLSSSASWIAECPSMEVSGHSQDSPVVMPQVLTGPYFVVVVVDFFFCGPHASSVDKKGATALPCDCLSQ